MGYLEDFNKEKGDVMRKKELSFTNFCLKYLFVKSSKEGYIISCYNRWFKL